MKNIDIDIDMVILENIDIDIDIDMDFLEYIDIDIDIDKGILQNIDIDKISYRLEFGISNRAILWQSCKKCEKRIPTPILSRLTLPSVKSINWLAKNTKET